jgi:hypothetical protein
MEISLQPRIGFDLPLRLVVPCIEWASQPLGYLFCTLPDSPHSSWELSWQKFNPHEYLRRFSAWWMFRIAHDAGRSSEKPKPRQCGQLSIAGVQHGRFHLVAGGRQA